MTTEVENVNGGLDIGYSSVKARFGTKDSFKDFILPAGVSKTETMQTGAYDGGNADVIKVNVNGVSYAAGFDPSRARTIRELHKDYIKTDAYKALFFAALAKSESNVIDRLVTGLPVEHFKDEAYRNYLVNLMEGEHDIAPSRTVTVNKVRVIPQPSGAYIHALEFFESQEKKEILDSIKNGRTLVIDPGFYSVDFVVLVNGEVRYDSSGSSTYAVSEIISKVSDYIHEEYSLRPLDVDIESAIRSKDGFIHHAGKKIGLEPYLEKAAKFIAPEVLAEVRSALRHLGGTIDVVILAGGGGKLYMKATQEAYSDSQVVTTEEPVMAVARGYFACCQ